MQIDAATAQNAEKKNDWDKLGDSCRPGSLLNNVDADVDQPRSQLHNPAWKGGEKEWRIWAKSITALSRGSGWTWVAFERTIIESRAYHLCRERYLYVEARQDAGLGGVHGTSHVDFNVQYFIQVKKVQQIWLMLMYTAWKTHYDMCEEKQFACSFSTYNISFK